MKNKILPSLAFITLLSLNAVQLFSQLPSYVPSSGILAWYAFNGNGADASGSGNNAVNNGATFVADRFGVNNGAASFNGSSSFMTVTTPTFTFSDTGSFTYSVWIKKQTQPAAGIILMTGNNVADNFITLLQGNSNFQYGTNKQQQPWIWLTCAHTLNVWDHYVATYANKTMTLYKNAVLQSTATFTYTGVNAANLPLYIGKGFGGGNFLGLIDDIGIWNRALTQQEVNILYSGTTGIEDVQEVNDITVHVNHTTITINSSPSVHSSLFDIYNVEGKKVFTGNITNTKQEVDIRTLNEGVYFLKTKNASIKFIKIQGQ